VAGSCERGVPKKERHYLVGFALQCVLVIFKTVKILSLTENWNKCRIYIYIYVCTYIYIYKEK